MVVMVEVADATRTIDRVGVVYQDGTSIAEVRYRIRITQDGEDSGFRQVPA